MLLMGWPWTMAIRMTDSINPHKNDNTDEISDEISDDNNSAADQNSSDDQGQS